MASSSVFVSCADYDDDINANKADIIAAQNDLTALKGQLSSIQSDLQGQLASLQTQLTNLKSDYETKIAQAQSELNAAIAKKADQSEIDALTQKLADLRLEFTNKVNAVEQRIAAVESAIEQIKTTLAGKADQSYVDNAIATINAALNGLVSKEDFTAVKNDVETLKTNLATLQALAAGFATKADVDKQIEAVNAAIAKLQSDFEAALAKKADLSYVDGQVEKVNEAINTLKGQIADINQAIKDIQAALATKANAEDLTNLDADLTKKINDLNDALSTKINEVQTYVTTYLVTNEKFDAAIELLNTTIANLKKSLEDAIALKADQSEVDKKADQAALQAAIDRIAALEGALVNINTLITNLQDNKANKADVDAAIANLQGQLNTLNAKIDAKDPQTLIDAALVSVKADIENIKATLALKADQTYVDAQLALVQDSLDIVAASVKDIYTKLAAVSGDLTAAEARLKALIDGLRADMNDSVKALNSKINLANAAIEDLKIQDKTILAFLGDITKGTLASQLAALKAEMSDDAKAKVDAEHQAMVDSVLKVKAAINKLEGDLGLLAGRVGTLEDNYAALRGEFDVLSGNYTDFKADLADKLNQIDEQLAAYSLDNLKILIKTVLTSITLIPDLYIDGIEAIRFTSVRYIPQRPNYRIIPTAYSNAEGYPDTPVITEGDSTGYKVDFADHQLENVPRANAVIIDNGETTAEYRLSPATVPDTAIDVENIAMWSKTADTETRTASLKKNDPVKPVYVSLVNGNLTVKLQKTTTQSIQFQGEGTKATIVSLMVPRKATKEGIEAADIYSEFSMLDEQVITPRLAALNLRSQTGEYGPATGAAIYNASNWIFEHPDLGLTHNNMSDSIHSMHYHFIDSLHIFSSLVDQNLYVKVAADYDKPFDLLNLVTGCYNTYNTDGTVKNHIEITKAALAKYGLAFRFQLPSQYNAITYNDWVRGYTSQNWNYTDQQKFAKLSENNPHNIITPVLPNDEQTTGNRAIIGKEPVVRAMLVDTVRGNLVDQAYFKVKWVDNKPDKDPIPVEFIDSGLLECDYNSMVVRWDKFINEVYAKLKDADGNATGMSWDEFRRYYPQTDVWRVATFVAQFTDNDSWIEQGNIYENGGRVRIYWLGGDYTSPNADANELWWHIGANQIGTILPAREKWMTTTIEFRSTDPKVYGPIRMTLKYKVKLPEKPKFHGYYSNYWIDLGKIHYVEPIQYGTSAYMEQLLGNEVDDPLGTVKANNDQYDYSNGLYSGQTWELMADGSEYEPYVPTFFTNDHEDYIAYCVYNSNLFNAFTYNEYGIIIDGGMPLCGTWDFQFRKSQAVTKSEMTGSKKSYNVRPDYVTKAHWDAMGKYGLTAYDYNEPLKPEGIVDVYTNDVQDIPTARGRNNEFGAYVLETETKDYVLKADKKTWAWRSPLEYEDAIWYNWDISQASWQHDPDFVEDDVISRPWLFADHNNAHNWALINPITAKNVGERPERSKDNLVEMGVFYKYNQWNCELIENGAYKFALVAPLDITEQMKGYFEDAVISGSDIDCNDAFTMIDFAGYEVRNVAPDPNVRINGQRETEYEYTKYRQDLYHYYEVRSPQYDLENVRYGLKWENNNLVEDPSATYRTALTAKQIKEYTNGNVTFSITQPDANTLRFKRNGGSPVENKFYCFIPATIHYGFGVITKYVKVPIWPPRQVPEGDDAYRSR